MSCSTASRFFNKALLSQKKIKPCTLIFIQQNDKQQLLLGMKKRGFGQFKWNGFGGKVEPSDKSIKAAAERELMEECSIKANNLIKRGLIIFEFDPEVEPTVLEVHVYSDSSYEGTPTESDEMKPEWYSFDKIPFDKMWAGK